MQFDPDVVQEVIEMVIVFFLFFSCCVVLVWSVGWLVGFFFLSLILLFLTFFVHGVIPRVLLLTSIQSEAARDLGNSVRENILSKLRVDDGQDVEKELKRLFLKIDYDESLTLRYFPYSLHSRAAAWSLLFVSEIESLSNLLICSLAAFIVVAMSSNRSCIPWA